MSQSENAKERSGLVAAMKAALTTILYTGIIVAVIGYGCYQGAGSGQEISESALSDVAYPGMPVQEFCSRLGIPPKKIDANGDLVISTTGWLSLFVAQRRATAKFDSNGLLTGVHVWTEHGISEDGRYLPLRGKHRDKVGSQ